MITTFTKWKNLISFEYDSYHKETFSDSFEIQNIYTDPDNPLPNNLKEVNEIKLQFTPYKGTCKISGDGQTIESNYVAIVAKIKEMKEYCFSISPQMCRMVEVPCIANWTYVE
jgi:hypothetical protein